MQKQIQTRKRGSGLISLLLSLSILIVSGFVILRAVQDSAALPSLRGEVDEETAAKLEELSRQLDDVRYILAHSEEYPASLLKLVANNPEAAEFVKQYPQHGLDTPLEAIEEVRKGEIPLLLQWDPRWGYTTYGSDFLAVTGCGPTCLSMVAAGLTGDNSITPYLVAEAAEDGGYYTEGYGSEWTIMSVLSADFGITATELPLDEGVMKQALSEGKPIVCSMNPGDFTESGHYIVLVGYEDGGFRVHDPNSPERSAMLWPYDRIADQIGNLWSFAVSD